VPGPLIRTLIVDDEPLARGGVRQLLSGDGELTIVGDCGDGLEAIRQIRELAVDLVFLDIQMPVIDGFGVIAEIGAEAMPIVVFLTAYDQHALQAFEAHALDYLLKPFSDQRFSRALAHAKRAVYQRRLGQAAQQLGGLIGTTAPVDPAGGESARYLTRVLVRIAGRTRFVTVADVDWIEAADYYSKLHAGGQTHLVRETMASLEGRLDPGRFVRVHRSAIVNIEHCVEIQPEFQGRFVLIMRDGARVPMSRSRRAQVEKALGERL
jgi:two-component system LytT family response regulator